MKVKILINLVVVALVSTFLQAQEMTAEKHSIRKIIKNENRVSDKKVSSADELNSMFTNATISGNLKIIYDGYVQEKSSNSNTYSTAIGGSLKYELAEFKGLSAGVELSTSYDIKSLSGDRDKNLNNSELSSSKGDYIDLTEAYVNYRLNDFNFRVGRQVVDTPLADSDDIRMIKNSFEAYITTYNYNGIEFMLGNLQKWQGYDASLDDGWIDVGENGTNFGGLSYSDVFEFDVWYYNIAKLTNAFYTDIGVNYPVNEKLKIHAMMQYLDEVELENSGTAASIYGALLELSVYDINFVIAYNRSNRIVNKSSFSGFGGGAMYTSMDTMIIDEIAQDRDADALVVGIEYKISDFNLLYAYGSFTGDKNSLGEKAHIVEQDISIEYTLDDNFSASAVYAMSSDEESSAKTDNDWNRVQVNLLYSF